MGDRAKYKPVGNCRHVRVEVTIEDLYTGEKAGLAGEACLDPFACADLERQAGFVHDNLVPLVIKGFRNALSGRQAG